MFPGIEKLVKHPVLSTSPPPPQLLPPTRPNLSQMTKFSSNKTVTNCNEELFHLIGLQKLSCMGWHISQTVSGSRDRRQGVTRGSIPGDSKRFFLSKKIK